MFQVNHNENEKIEKYDLNNTLNRFNINSQGSSKKRLIKINTNSVDSPNRIKEFFMRKTESNFIKNSLSPIKSIKNVTFSKRSFSEFINFLKTDIIQIDNMIRKYSEIFNYYKKPDRNGNGVGFGIGFITLSGNINQNGSQINFKKRCLDIERNNSIVMTTYFEKITENCQNLDYLFKDFNCKTKEELICRLAFENYFNQLFINKTSELIFLCNLKFNNENNEMANNYTQSHSKFNELKYLIDKLERKENCEKNKELNLSSDNSKSEEIIESDDDVTKILEFNTISDILKFPTNNNIIKHLKFLFSQYNDKALNIFSSLINKILSSSKNNNKLHKIRKTDELIENFLIIRKIYEEVYFTLEKENRELNDKYEALLKDNKKLILIMNEINERDVKNVFKKIEDENYKLYENIKEYEKSGKLKLFDELKNIYVKCDTLTITNNILNEDKIYLENQINHLKPKNKLNLLKGDSTINLDESFEILLQEQFQNMRNSFLEKITETRKESLNYKKTIEKEITKLQDENKLNKSFRELFMNQNTELKRLLEVNVF